MCPQESEHKYFLNGCSSILQYSDHLSTCKYFVVMCVVVVVVVLFICFLFFWFVSNSDRKHPHPLY